VKKALVIIGTRPEAIKLAPVVHALQRRSDNFDTRVCLTGQHHEMLYQAIDHMEIPYHYDLRLMTENQTLSEITASLVTHLDTVIAQLAPDIILVQGDTTSAFVGAMAGFYRKVAVGHVEAGLRTNNKYSPFPEEMNRRLVGVLADYHYVPTERAKQALLGEGIALSSIFMTGNTVIDALQFTLAKIERQCPSLGKLESVLDRGNRIILVTGHRRENFGKGFQNICAAIRKLSLTFPEITIVYPVHLNPNVQKPVYSVLGNLPNVHLVQPLPYLPFVRMMKTAHIILTDSGGIQEEATALGKPVLVMREATERQEAIDAGSAILVGTDIEKIFSHAATLISDNGAWEKMSKVSSPFGDGRAAERIADHLERLPD
jgi:UDP-N-acetylglucosamine 2-epimerase (non-hydrolysing)